MKERRLLYAIGWVKDEYIIEMNIPGKAKTTRLSHRKMWLIAALIALAVLLVGCGILYSLGLFDSPADMISVIFGNETGYDRKDTTYFQPQGHPDSETLPNPGFERVPADQEAVEDIAPNVSPVGQSITFNGITLTVDAFLYDSKTQCGVVTYTMEQDEGVLEYQVNTDGRITYTGLTEPDFSLIGYHYIIQSKTTDTVLAASYFFHIDSQENDLSFSVRINNGMTGEGIRLLNERVLADVKAMYTSEEAIQERHDILAELGVVMSPAEDLDYNQQAELAYQTIATQYLKDHNREYEEASYSPGRISFDCSKNQQLPSIMLYEGDITITPISVLIDVSNMDFMRWDVHGRDRLSADNVRDIIIHFSDGSNYLMISKEVNNTVYTQSYVLYGDGTTDIMHFTAMFNRVIDVENIIGITINGTSIEMERINENNT